MARGDSRSADRLATSSDFCARGRPRDLLADGEDVVLFATSEHWKAVDERLNSTECRVGSEIAKRRLTVVDARDSLDAIMKQDCRTACFSRNALHARSRRTVGRRSAPSKPRRRTSMPRSACTENWSIFLLRKEISPLRIALEKLWNDLLNSVSFMLLCGYSSAHFCGPRVGSALRDVCGCHSLIEDDEDNSLASFLIRESERRRSALRVFVCSGECRMVDTADAARLNSHFFWRLHRRIETE
jgi:hypothetical protein